MTEVDQLVRPFYLRLLHGNFRRDDPEARLQFFASLRQASVLAEPKALTRLFNAGGWRERLSAAWFAGLIRNRQFEDRISDLLLKSELCFAGQAYCFALARFRSPESSGILRAYLETYLPVGDRIYDQEWALGALTSIEPESVGSVPRDLSTWKPLQPDRGVQKFLELIAIVEKEWE